mmetsp:Transcript_22978/g.49996  ORF Transcript_22978/g.49996 Transcript_22978/m.49996 type:complete len:361 (+) Transcript_22978:1181-2263(+)
MLATLSVATSPTLSMVVRLSAGVPFSVPAPSLSPRLCRRSSALCRATTARSRCLPRRSSSLSVASSSIVSTPSAPRLHPTFSWTTRASFPSRQRSSGAMPVRTDSVRALLTTSAFRQTCRTSPVSNATCCSAPTPRRPSPSRIPSPSPPTSTPSLPPASPSGATSRLPPTTSPPHSCPAPRPRWLRNGSLPSSRPPVVPWARCCRARARRRSTRSRRPDRSAASTSSSTPSPRLSQPSPGSPSIVSRPPASLPPRRPSSTPSLGSAIARPTASSLARFVPASPEAAWAPQVSPSSWLVPRSRSRRASPARWARRARRRVPRRRCSSPPCGLRACPSAPTSTSRGSLASRTGSTSTSRASS